MRSPPGGSALHAGGTSTCEPASASGRAAGCEGPPRSSTCITLSSASPAHTPSARARAETLSQTPAARAAARGTAGARSRPGAHAHTACRPARGPARTGPHVTHLHRCRGPRRCARGCGERRPKATAAAKQRGRPPPMASHARAASAPPPRRRRARAATPFRSAGSPRAPTPPSHRPPPRGPRGGRSD